MRARSTGIHNKIWFHGVSFETETTASIVAEINQQVTAPGRQRLQFAIRTAREALDDRGGQDALALANCSDLMSDGPEII